MDKKHWIHKIHLPAWLVGILALVLFLRVPSFFEPYYYGDEMIYLTLGQGIKNGVTLYKEIHDNKPPLLYLTAAIAGNLFLFKVILAFWIGLTIVAFWRLTKGKLATFIFAILTTIPLLEGNTANAELFMIGPSIIAFYYLLTKTQTFKNIVFAGILFGVATLFKVPAAFDMPVIIAFWVITEGLKDWKKIIKKTSILILGFLIPLAITFIWYYFKGALPEYIKAAFLQNVGYVSSFRPQDVQKSFIVRNLPLLIRAALVFVGFLILWLLGLKKKLPNNFIFYSLWLIFSLFAVTLSERPYPHYLIQSVPAISALVAMLLTARSISQIYTIIPLTIALFVPFYYHFYNYPTFSYYLKFAKFSLGKINRSQYLSSFSPNVERNYQIAEFLSKSSLPSDKVFMWDPDSPTVYALSRRLPPTKYVADYHVLDFSSKSDLAKILIANPPKFIILTSGHNFDEIMGFVKDNYLLISQFGNADIWVKINER